MSFLIGIGGLITAFGMLLVVGSLIVAAVDDGLYQAFLVLITGFGTAISGQVLVALGRLVEATEEIAKNTRGNAGEKHH